MDSLLLIILVVVFVFFLMQSKKTHRNVHQSSRRVVDRIKNRDDL